MVETNLYNLDGPVLLVKELMMPVVNLEWGRALVVIFRWASSFSAFGTMIQVASI